MTLTIGLALETRTTHLAFATRLDWLGRTRPGPFARLNEAIRSQLEKMTRGLWGACLLGQVIINSLAFGLGVR